MDRMTHATSAMPARANHVPARPRWIRATGLLAALAAQCVVGSATAQVKLADLPELARARAAARRPALEQALAPFLDDLGLEYSSNKTYLSERLDDVVALGGGIAPLLLERLTPPDDTKKALHRAENSRRVLERLDPASFETALVDLLDGESATARRSAIVLLAQAKTPGAARALGARVATLTPPEHRAMAVEAIAEIGDPASAAHVLPLLADTEETVRAAALDWVDRAASDASPVRDALLAGLKRERVPTLMPRFVRALATRAKNDTEVADALRPLLTDTRLSRQGLQTMLRGLGAIAPQGHEPSLKALTAIVDRDSGPTGLSAATAMRDLGNRKGLETLYENLSKTIKDNRPKRRALRPSWSGDAGFRTAQQGCQRLREGRPVLEIWPHASPGGARAGQDRRPTRQMVADAAPAKRTAAHACGVRQLDSGGRSLPRSPPREHPDSGVCGRPARRPGRRLIRRRGLFLTLSKPDRTLHRFSAGAVVATSRLRDPAWA